MESNGHGKALLKKLEGIAEDIYAITAVYLCIWFLEIESMISFQHNFSWDFH